MRMAGKGIDFTITLFMQLTSEEVSKRSRRRELNRLAARRSREKGQRRKDMLVEEIRKLQSHNTELMDMLGNLTEQRNQIIDTLRQHMKQCSDYEATQKASVGLSHRVLSMLGVHTSEPEPPEPPQLALSGPSVPTAPVQPPPAVADVSGMSALYISTSELGSSPSKHTMSPGPYKNELGSCHPSPHVLNLDNLSGPLTNFQEGFKEPVSPLIDSIVANSSIKSSGEKFHEKFHVSENSKVQIMLQSPAPNLQAQVFLMSSPDISSPLLRPNPSVQSYALRTSTTFSTIDSSNLAQVKTVLDVDPKAWSSSPSPTRTAVNIQVPILKEGPPLVPILPKPGKLYERRNSIASLSGSSEEGIAMLLPHASLIGTSSSPMQSAPSDSGLGSSQEEGGDGIGEEVVQYKHKLMKHRKQHSSDFTHPSRRGGMVGEGKAAVGRPSLLERSFSFPSSRSEHLRSSSSDTLKYQSPAVFTASTFPSSSQASSSSLGFPQNNKSSKTNSGFAAISLPTCVSPSVTTSKSMSEALPSELPSSFSSSEDLSALPTGSKKTSSIFKFYETTTDTPFVSDTMDEVEARGWASPMDTWPPAGPSRSSHQFSLQFPTQERRWSVDDYPVVPLNLSRRSSQDEIGGVSESIQRTASSRSNSPASLSGSHRETYGPNS
ncbi:basic leucine zipper transcriptional factor ATF-like 3 [Elysia marginata]|uniref:Basic leucine zipper transcriptional factor ATF-like 3 n=1 Tax=Elysia marginata TaxID=1093978 RepID=A0AAV4FZP5_9GAST|nr:basic leucine zipper transcriptional factor ATF-like 3 [Elysia marginata]